MRRIKRTAVIMLAGLFLWGCGDASADSKGGETAAAGEDGGIAKTESVSQSSIYLRKDGKIEETIKEDFAEAIYDEAGLKNMLLSEAAEFNNSSKEVPIAVDQFENKKGVVTIMVKYPSAASYQEFYSNEFSSKDLFSGTIEEAYAAGYSMDVTLVNVKDKEETIGREELLQMGQYKILIAAQPSDVKIDGKILYAGENVEIAGKNKARLKTDENGKTLGNYYIVFK